MSKKCTPLWREADFEVSKVLKTGGTGPLLDVQISFLSHGRRKGAPCQKWAKLEGFVAVSKTSTTTLHYTPLHYTYKKNYTYKKDYNYNVTLHYTTLDYTKRHDTTLLTLHYTTLHSTTLRYTQLHWIKLRYTTLITLHYATLRYTTLHHTTPHRTRLQHKLKLQLQQRYFTLHYTDYTTLPYITLHYTHYTATNANYTTAQLQLHYTTTTAALRHTTSSSCGWGDWPGDHCNHSPLQKTQLQPPSGPSVDSLCHPWFTSTNLCYRSPIFETSATALCGTTGILAVVV